MDIRPETTVPGLLYWKFFKEPIDKPHSEIYISAQVGIISQRHMKIRADLIFEFDKCIFR